MEETIKNEIMEFVSKQGIAMVCSVDKDGYPNSKAMFVADREDLSTFLFSTNTSSTRTKHFQNNAKACIYFCDLDDGRGLMLVGEMEVTRDKALREKIWVDGCEKYYPQGVDDPDYSVLRFTAKTGDYYHALKKYVFNVDEI